MAVMDSTSPDQQTKEPGLIFACQDLERELDRVNRRCEQQLHENADLRRAVSECQARILKQSDRIEKLLDERDVAQSAANDAMERLLKLQSALADLAR